MVVHAPSLCLVRLVIPVFDLLSGLCLFLLPDCLLYHRVEEAVEKDGDAEDYEEAGERPGEELSKAVRRVVKAAADIELKHRREYERH